MNPIKLITVLFTALLITACQSQPVQVLAPEVASPSSLATLTELGDSLVAEKKFAGASFAVIKDGVQIHSSMHGVYGIDNPKPIAEDTLFRIFSMTKPITAVAAMMLHEEGKFDLDDPVADYLPQFKNPQVMGDDGIARPAKNVMTIRQLLTHSAGFTYGFAPDSIVDKAYFEAQLFFRSPDLDTFIDNLAALPLKHEPGTQYRYSVSIDVVGAIVEKISGQSLEAFFKERIFTPLAMTDTFFRVPAEKMHRVASFQYWNPETKQIDMMPNEYQNDLTKVALYSGGGGLVSSLGDYLKFCQMLLNGGEGNGARLLKAETVALMMTDHMTPEVRSAGGPYPDINIYDGTSMGLGFSIVYDETQLPEEYSQGEVAWSGLAATQFFIDPSQNLAAVAMVQLARHPWELDRLLRVETQHGIDQLDDQE